MKNIKGELTTQQIVGIIVLIASFMIILFLLFRLGLGSETNQEICRNSVILKGGSPLPENSVSLKCYKNYECISNDGDCENLNSPDKNSRVESVDEVYQELADGMARCWWMFGEGKINYVGDDLTKNNYCSICSQIELDESLKDVNGIAEGKISRDGLYDYLSTTKVPREDVTYLEYIFGTKDLVGLKRQIIDSENNTKGIETFGEIETEKQYYVVMGITSGVSGWKWIGGGAGAGASTASLITVGSIILGATNPIGWVSGAALIGAGVIGGSIGSGIAETVEPQVLALTVQGRGINNKFMAPTIVEVDSEKFRALNCEDVLTLS